MRSSECDVVSLYVVCCSVNVSACFVCCVFDSVCELLGETICNVFGCSCYFLLNVVDVFSVCGCALLDRPCMVFQSVCVCCACDPNGCLSAPSICFALCFCMSEVISSFRSLRAGSQVFALLMSFI